MKAPCKASCTLISEINQGICGSIIPNQISPMNIISIILHSGMNWPELNGGFSFWLHHSRQCPHAAGRSSWAFRKSCNLWWKSRRTQNSGHWCGHHPQESGYWNSRWDCQGGISVILPALLSSYENLDCDTFEQQNWQKIFQLAHTWSMSLKSDIISFDVEAGLLSGFEAWSWTRHLTVHKFSHKEDSSPTGRNTETLVHSHQRSSGI